LQNQQHDYEDLINQWLLTNALKQLQDKNTTVIEIYRNGYVSNEINILKCIKGDLKQSNILFSFKNGQLYIFRGLNFLIRLYKCLLYHDSQFIYTSK